MVTNGTNGSSHRTLKTGVWAPIPTFFDDNEEIDLATFKSHVVRLAKAGMQPVVCGSMGEAFHLTHDERVTLFKAAREALDEAGLTETTIIAGTGGNSTRETIALCKSAASARADAVIVITPGYFSFGLSKAAIKQFFLDVQAASPLPVMIYNFPGASGGIDLDSDLVREIVREGPNICGIKLTCGAVGKLTRITADTHDREFVTLGGFADFLLPTVLGSRAHGAIMGLGNIYPNALYHLLTLAEKLSKSSNAEELTQAIDIQDLASGADQAFARAGIAGTKWWLVKYNGYPNGRMRRPLVEYDDERLATLAKDPAVQKFMELEKSLAAKQK